MKGSSTFFLPVKVMSRLFRGKFLHALKKAHEQGDLQFKGSTEALGHPSIWQALVDKLYRVDWVVYAKPPFGGPLHVFRYLGQYTHRVAISNHRLMAIKEGKVSFRVRDYADQSKKKISTLSAVEFIRRYLLHVLPRKFTRIRHFGLMAARNIQTKLATAMQLLGKKVESEKAACKSTDSTPWWEKLLQLTGVDIMRCPVCKKGRLQRQSTCASSSGEPLASIRFALDTS